MSYMAYHAVVIAIPMHATINLEPGQPSLGDIETFRESLSPWLRKLLVGPIQSEHNGIYMVTLLPDGSKEGWPESDEGDAARAKLIEMFSWRYPPVDGEDQGTPYNVVEVRFGGDLPRHTGITFHLD